MTVNPPIDADLDTATIYHLDRMGWNFGRIAGVVDVDRDTIMRILQDIHAGSVSAVSVAPLAIRLTKDARQLRILLPSDPLPESPAVILARIKAHCVRRHINLTLTEETLAERLRAYVTGAWLTIGAAVPPTPAIDERVRVLVPPMGGRNEREAEEDISPGGVRCRIMTTLSAESLAPQLPVQLKFVLPGHADQVIAIARVAHVLNSDMLGLAFLQITLCHADQVMQWYLELLRGRKTLESSNPGDRRGGRRPAQ